MAFLDLTRREWLTGMAAFAATVPSLATAATPFKSGRISVVTRGQGPDVILIPGLTAARTMWNSTVAALPGYRYHLVQIAGFAGDPPLDNKSGAILVPVAEEVVRYIIASGLKAPAIVGHSMGGLLALLIATRWPARAGRTMVIDMLPAPTEGLGSSVAGVKPLAEGLRNVLTSSPEGRQVFGSLMDMFGVPTKSEAGGSDADVVARSLHEIALTDLRPELSRISHPISVLYSTIPGARYDGATVQRLYRAAYANARGANLQYIAGSGHMIMYDQPKLFQKALRTFLA